MLAALVVLLLGGALLASGPEDWIADCPPGPETADYDLHVDLVPPNTRTCVVTSGGRVAEASWTPWDGWLLVVAWALAAFVLFSRGRLLIRVTDAAALWLGGLFAYFWGVT